ncbi:hypothetical protein [Halovenus salina]|uniref:Uncharacterized protein n=1 Tax=Halovenus salina TaxID=1510225 RepID=A0ABD5W136_9EURY|nr:hypothetical protein [Halovenus salina]
MGHEHETVHCVGVDRAMGRILRVVGRPNRIDPLGDDYVVGGELWVVPAERRPVAVCRRGRRASGGSTVEIKAVCGDWPVAGAATDEVVTPRRAGERFDVGARSSR